MRDVFAAMPDSIAPMTTRNNRLDCIDYIENNMEARVRNKLDENVLLEALTADYARFRTSTSAFLEMKLLPQTDTTSVLCLVRTAQTGEPDTPRRLEDSTIRFFQPDWTPLDTLTSSFFSLPSLDHYLSAQAADSLSASSPAFESALRSLQSFHPVRLALGADAFTLTAQLQPAYLATDERSALLPHLRPLLFRWNGSRFVLE
ncbi:MAG: DUF3256 family protein [Bacteroidaceae bacterium]|nr:DUF3256 family protein [Bacteroidaceae bacterium]